MTKKEKPLSKIEKLELEIKKLKEEIQVYKGIALDSKKLAEKQGSEMAHWKHDYLRLKEQYKKLQYELKISTGDKN